MIFDKPIKFSRKVRSKYLEPIGKFLLEHKLTANHFTGLSLILGLLGAYFLFQNNWLFATFISLHLAADGLDGVMARLSNPTLFGDYFDKITDQLISFLLLLKIYFYLNDYYVIIMLFMFVLTYIIYFGSKMTYPCIFVRTGVVITMLFFPLWPNFTTIGTYLVIGGFMIYSLILQLRYFLEKKVW